MSTLINLPMNILGLILYYVAGNIVHFWTGSEWSTLSQVHRLFAMQKWVERVWIDHTSNPNILNSFRRIQRCHIFCQDRKRARIPPWDFELPCTLKVLEIHLPMNIRIHLSSSQHCLRELLVNMNPVFLQHLSFPFLQKCTLYGHYRFYNLNLQFAPNCETLTVCSSKVKTLSNVPSSLTMLTLACESLEIKESLVGCSQLTSFTYAMEKMMPEETLTIKGLTIANITTMTGRGLEEMIQKRGKWIAPILYSFLQHNTPTLQEVSLSTEISFAFPHLPHLQKCEIVFGRTDDLDPFIKSLPPSLHTLAIRIQSSSCFNISLQGLNDCTHLRHLTLDAVEFNQIGRLDYLDTLTIGSEGTKFIVGRTTVHAGMWSYYPTIPFNIWKMIQGAFPCHHLPNLPCNSI